MFQGGCQGGYCWLKKAVGGQGLTVTRQCMCSLDRSGLPYALDTAEPTPTFAGPDPKCDGPASVHRCPLCGCGGQQLHTLTDQCNQTRHQVRSVPSTAPQSEASCTGCRPLTPHDTVTFLVSVGGRRTVQPGARPRIWPLFCLSCGCNLSPTVMPLPTICVRWSAGAVCCAVLCCAVLWCVAHLRQGAIPPLKRQSQFNAARGTPCRSAVEHRGAAGPDTPQPPPPLPGGGGLRDSGVGAMVPTAPKLFCACFPFIKPSMF